MWARMKDYLIFFEHGGHALVKAIGLAHALLLGHEEHPTCDIRGALDLGDKYDLHVYFVKDREGQHYYIAASVGSALLLHESACLYCGGNAEQLTYVEPLEDTSKLTVTLDGGRGPATKTCAQWIEETAVGMLASSAY